MAEANDIHGSIYQNLIDAGCDTEKTDQCMTFVENGSYFGMLPIPYAIQRNIAWIDTYRPNEPKELLIILEVDHASLYDDMEKIPFDKLVHFFKENL